MTTSTMPVSSESELLIVVDQDDRVLGHKTKGECHDGDGVLHRAFSIFLFNSRGQVLLQQRSAQKRLWGGFWSNSCCSHPRKGEEIAEAAVRRLFEEMGIETSLSTLYKFIYQARFGDAGSEHELCAVLVGKSDGVPAPHPDEISAWKWLDPRDLDRELANNPGVYTPWFKMEWQRLRSEHAADLAGLQV